MKNIDSWELSSASQTSTGLPMNVWFQSNSRKIDRKPMLLVQINNSSSLNFEQTAIVTIEDCPEVITESPMTEANLESVKDFIALNKEVLLAHWNCEIDTFELFSSIRKIL